MTLAVPWIQPFPSQREEGSFSVLYRTILQGQKRSGSFMIYAYSQQICSERLPLGAQNMYGESGEWQSWQSVLQELTHQQERPLASPPTLGEFFMLPHVPFYPVNGMGIDLVKVPKCLGYGAGEWGGKEQSGLTMHCSQWSSVICQSGPWT